MSGKWKAIRPLRSQHPEHPVGHIKTKLLNCGDSSLFLSLLLSPNPDVWHLTNIVQDLLDWEQNKCRERGSSFSESTTGSKPIKKQETQHKPDLRRCISLALSLFLQTPTHTHSCAHTRALTHAHVHTHTTSACSY